MNETVYYVVQILRHWDSLEVLGLPLAARQYPDCIGFMPVFQTEDGAKVWRDNHSPTAGIAAIAPSPKPEAK